MRMLESQVEALLPQIDDLTVEQLRQRATIDREDALRLSTRQDSGAVVMLLADAERCEARADLLEAHCAPARLAGLEGLTVEGALDRLLEAGGERQYVFAAAGVDGARRGPQGHRSPTVADAYMVALGSLRPAGILS